MEPMHADGRLSVAGAFYEDRLRSIAAFRSLDLRSFRVVARRLRGRPDLGPNWPEKSGALVAVLVALGSLRERVCVVGHDLAFLPTTQHANLQGIFAGATGLEPATSGVTGRFNGHHA
jgi:hypothetical protein